MTDQNKDVRSEQQHGNNPNQGSFDKQHGGQQGQQGQHGQQNQQPPKKDVQNKDREQQQDREKTGTHR